MMIFDDYIAIDTAVKAFVCFCNYIRWLRKQIKDKKADGLPVRIADFLPKFEWRKALKCVTRSLIKVAPYMLTM